MDIDEWMRSRTCRGSEIYNSIKSPTGSLKSRLETFWFMKKGFPSMTGYLFVDRCLPCCPNWELNCCWLPSLVFVFKENCSTSVEGENKLNYWYELSNTPSPSSYMLKSFFVCKSGNCRLPSSYTTDLKLLLADVSIWQSSLGFSKGTISSL